MQKNKVVFGRFALFLGVLLLCSGLVLAAYNVTNSIGGSAFNFNEDASRLINLTINNTQATGAGNVSQVNITLPTNFSYTFNTANTSAASGIFTFTNSSTTVLSFTNASAAALIGNATFARLWVNATPSSPGTFNITVLVLNISNGLQTTNITVVVNDTTVPENVSFVSALGYTNQSGTIVLNASIIDNGVLDGVFFNITNNTGASNVTLAASGLTTAGNSFWNASLNTEGLRDGYYNVTILANDTFNNTNSSFVTRFLVDNTDPTVDLSQDESGYDFIDLRYSCSDTLSGMSSCSISSDSGTVDDNRITGLDCGTDYDIDITGTDYAGNTATDTVSMSTGSCGGGSSGGGSGSGSGSGSGDTTTWTNTFQDDQSDLSEIKTVNHNIGSAERIKLKVAGDTHYVGVLSLTETSAVIQVSSTPQQTTLAVGESQKFDVDGDGFYDLQVMVNSIANGKADVTTTYLHEEVPVTDDTTAANGSTSSGSGMVWIWVVVAVVVIVVVVFFVVRARKNN